MAAFMLKSDCRRLVIDTSMYIGPGGTLFLTRVDDIVAVGEVSALSYVVQLLGKRVRFREVGTLRKDDDSVIMLAHKIVQTKFGFKTTELPALD